MILEILQIVLVSIEIVIEIIKLLKNDQHSSSRSIPLALSHCQVPEINLPLLRTAPSQRCQLLRCQRFILQNYKF